MREAGYAAPEHRLLLAVLRSNPRSDDVQRIFTREDVDWDAFIRLASASKVLPLAERNLRETAFAQIPKEARSALYRHRVFHARRNLRRTGELLRLLSDFEGHGVDALAFKGPLLAQELYDDVSMRQYNDLDVLVPPAQFADAVALMPSFGYEQVRPSQRFDADHLSAIVRRLDLHDFVFVHSDSRTPVELHCRLVSRSTLRDSALLTERRGSVLFGGKTVATLLPESLMLYLCVHGSKHNWRRLCWLTDVAAFAEGHRTLDVDGLWATAVRLGAARRLCLGYYLAHRALGAAIPKRLQREIDQRDSILGALSANCTFLPPRESDGPVLFYLKTQARLMERPRDRIRFAASLLMMPKRTDVAAQSRPPRSVRRYFFYRFLRLLLMRPFR